MTQPPRSPAPPRFNWRCAFGLHPWEKWSDPQPHRVEHIYPTTMTTTTYEETQTVQTRMCAHCGAMAVRRVR